MKYAPALALFLSTTACVRVERAFQDTVPADGVESIYARVDRGSFSYRGSEMLDDFHVSGVSSGNASSQARAEEKANGNLWSVDAQDSTLVVMGESLDNGSLAFQIDGPDLLNTDIEVDNGAIRLDGLTGSHYLTADSVVLQDLQGNVDVYARESGVSIEMMDVWESVQVESVDGSVDLWLPYGLEYDLEIWGDPEYALTVEDLGFEDSYVGEGYFAGDAGRAIVEVTLKVYGGSVSVYRSF